MIHAGLIMKKVIVGKDRYSNRSLLQHLPRGEREQKIRIRAPEEGRRKETPQQPITVQGKQKCTETAKPGEHDNVES